MQKYNKIKKTYYNENMNNDYMSSDAEYYDNQNIQEEPYNFICPSCGYSGYIEDEEDYDEYYVDDNGNVYDLQDDDYVEYEPEKTDDFYYENKNTKKFLKLKKIKEKTKLKEEVENENVAEILKILRDQNFGNDEQRKKLISLLTSLFAIKDKSSRLIFKKLGIALTNIGDEMLNDNEVDEYYPSVEENEMDMENEYEPNMENIDMMDNDYDMYENNKIKKYKFKSVLDESTENYRKKLNEINDKMTKSDIIKEIKISGIRITPKKAEEIFQKAVKKRYLIKANYNENLGEFFFIIKNYKFLDWV